MNMAEAKRPYRMTARAEAAHATAERIMDATLEVFWERPTDQVSVAEVARRSGVTKQTVLRRFGSREQLLAAAGEREAARIDAERDPGVADDLAEAVRGLVDHYERVGDAVVRLLAAEVSNPALVEISDRGRAYHAAWCERAFAPALAPLRGAERARRLAQCIAVTDVLVWKLLRRDRALSRRQTETAIRELAEQLAGGPA